jgi:uncharacterized protein involved in cysteine biosynthesis
LAFPRLAGIFAPEQRQLPEWLDFSLLLSLGGGIALAGMLLGLAFSIVVSQPALEHLVRRVEREELGGDSRHGGPEGLWSIESLRNSAALLGAMLLVLLLALIPLVGPILGAAGGALVLGQRLAESVLIRHGLGRAERRAFRRRYRPESLGLGAAAVAILAVPVVNPLLLGPLTPALCLGATRLVVELRAAEDETPEEGPGASERPRPQDMDEARLTG